MIFEHYSEHLIEEWTERPLLDSRNGCKLYNKPNGFWFSVVSNKDWPTHVKDAQLAKPLRYRYSVELHLDRLISINSIWDIGRFQKRFLKGNSIDWEEVAKHYSGFIVPLYREFFVEESLRWYESLDCSSGCVWDLSAIKSIKLEDENPHRDYVPNWGEEDA